MAHWAATVPQAEPAMPPARAVDEGEVEHAVGGEAADGDVQRRAGVLQAAQYAGGREDGEHGRDAERADPQIGDGVRGGVRRGAEEVDEAGCGGQGGQREGRAEQQGEPDAVHALPDGGRQVPGADAARDGRGGGVGEEDEDADGGGEQRGGHGETGELAGPEVAHDGGVGQHEEGLGDECAEGGHGEREDLAVESAAGAYSALEGFAHTFH
ncbi:hypothetical protein GCM10020221_28160 [Streptomyces thioluteus]|uniref:Uncharacterized protein n=1 Tax=Streptomyces thioluteus TaxID=66431 RepID=A0ABN3WXU6_STRTU